jgi:ubiquinone/menaquinone biosynthesis C-methylase UbiE
MFFLNYSTVVDPFLRGIRVYTLRFSGMRAGDRVLDVCCGTGDQVYYYARAGMLATGIDLDPAMLRLAEKDKRRKVLDNVSFHLADARSLPFEDNSFDYVSISFALHEKERDARDEVISEMKRVVRAEGALIFVDFQVPLPKKLLSRLVRAAEFIAGGQHYRCFKDYLAQGGLDVLLARNRLTEARRDYLNSGAITIIKTPNP